jgi:hypothetical protein
MPTPTSNIFKFVHGPRECQANFRRHLTTSFTLICTMCKYSLAGDTELSLWIVDIRVSSF